MKKFLSQYPLAASIVLTEAAGTLGISFYTLIRDFVRGSVSDLSAESVMAAIPAAALISALLFYPLVLTICEAVFLFLEARKHPVEAAWHFDQAAIWYGLFLEVLYAALMKEITGADWQVQLSNGETHTPIYSAAAPTIIVIFLLALAGYYYLSFRPMEKMPPLLIVLSMSAMYLGMTGLIVFTVQIMGREMEDLILLIYPICIALIIARTILRKVHAWPELPMEKRRIRENAFLQRIDHLLSDSGFWPIYALLLMLPLLGILIAVLVLFGQAPDSIVKAWTETSDWALSAKEAPQNIYYDEHYLCTVAAGGHRNVVKPIRRGVRHGHVVIVNRQLCVANAFEQLLEERTPRLHRVLRAFYDRYGFPIARLIRSKWAADFVYFLMKPLEWLFVASLYLTEVHPEDRIAVQYMGKLPEYRKQPPALLSTRENGIQIRETLKKCEGTGR